MLDAPSPRVPLCGWRSSALGAVEDRLKAQLVLGHCQSHQPEPGERRQAVGAEGGQVPGAVPLSSRFITLANGIGSRRSSMRRTLALPTRP